MTVKETLKETEQNVDNKMRQDVAKVKKDVNIMVGDGVTQLTEGFDKVASEARETVVSAAETVKRDLGYGLNQYNEKAQDIATKVPGDLVNQVAKYPWVAISVALTVGFLLGGLLKPARKSAA